MVCHLGLGANIAYPAYQLAAAISALAASPEMSLHRISSVYLTKPAGFTDQPSFFNMALAIRTNLSPSELLNVIANIESALGRERSIKDGPRTIDIDILVCGQITCERAELTVPHPRMKERQFVLTPLSEIAPDLILPDGCVVAQLVEDDCREVCRLGRLAGLVRAGRFVPEVCADAQ